MSANYTDGDFTKKWPIGKARKSYPIEGDVATYLIEQDYMQLRSSYSEAALNTTHYTAMGGASPTDGGAGGDSSAYLVEIGAHQDMGQSIVKWTETYSKKPAERDEYESYTYNFIGFYGAFGINATTIAGRDRFIRPTMARVAFKYYIPGVDGGITTASDIPLILVQTYIYGSTTNNVDYLADSPPFAAATTPSRTTYETWMASSSHGSNGGEANGELVAEQSQVRRWKGGIYERATRYIKAQ